MRDEEVNKMKTQIAVIGNIEEDFVKTLSYLKELSDQVFINLYHRLVNSKLIRINNGRK